MKVRNVAVALVIVAVLIVGGFAYLGSVFVNTDGVSYRYRGVEGGTQANSGRGDLLDSTAYVTSWTGGGVSEKIVLRGHFRATPAVFAPEFARYWYKVALTSDNPNVQINGITGTSWESIKFEVTSGSDPTPWTYGDWIATESVIVTLTNPCSGKIHAELWGHVNDLNPSSSDDGILASDEAYLRSGVGSVKVQNDVVEEGTTANFFVETGYAHTEKTDVSGSGEGWYLNIYNPAGGSVLTKTIGDNFAGTISWLVPNGSYSPSSTNVWKVLLRNELIDQDDDWFFTVGPGMIKQIPGKPSFEIQNPQKTYVAGDKIDVLLTAKKNPSGYDIAGFWVWVSYETSAGTTTHYLIEKAWYPANAEGGGIFTAQVSFVFPDAGNARLEASTADVKNLNSGIAEMSWTVYGPTDNHNNNGGPQKVDWLMVILGIVAMIGAVALGALLIWYMPKPWGLGIGIVVILVGIAGGVTLILSGVPL